MPLSSFLLLLSGTFSAIASILLRIAGQASVRNGSAAMAFFSFDRVMLFRIFALGAYGGGFVLYALALRKIQLSIAYPLMVGVTILEVMVFGLIAGEAITLRTLIGAGLLIVSLVVLYLPTMTAA